MTLRTNELVPSIARQDAMREWQRRNRIAVNAKARESAAQRAKARAEFVMANRDVLLAERKVTQRTINAAIKTLMDPAQVQQFTLQRDMDRKRRKDAKHYATKRRGSITEMLYACKTRAKQKGLEFNLVEADIVIPEKCPALGKPLSADIRRNNPWRPSVDRIDNDKGYIRGNVVIVSYRANKLKNNATIDELRRMAYFYSQIQGESLVPSQT